MGAGVRARPLQLPGFAGGAPRRGAGAEPPGARKASDLGGIPSGARCAQHSLRERVYSLSTRARSAFVALSKGGARMSVWNSVVSALAHENAKHFQTIPDRPEGEGRGSAMCHEVVP